MATATTDANGRAKVDVPAGDLVVSAPDAPPYMDCDAPAVIATARTTTAVTQTCVVLVP